MKQIFLIGCTFLLLAAKAHSQCDKSITWLSSKSLMMDEKGNVVKTLDGDYVIQTSNKEIKVNMNGADTPVMSGAVSAVNCEWKEAYKNGKTVLTSEMEDESGDIKHVEMTIEAKDGKIEILARAKERPNQVIKMIVDKYEEK